MPQVFLACVALQLLDSDLAFSSELSFLRAKNFTTTHARRTSMLL